MLNQVPNPICFEANENSIIYHIYIFLHLWVRGGRARSLRMSGSVHMDQFIYSKIWTKSSSRTWAHSDLCLFRNREKLLTFNMYTFHSCVPPDFKQNSKHKYQNHYEIGCCWSLGMYFGNLIRKAFSFQISSLDTQKHLSRFSASVLRNTTVLSAADMHFNVWVPLKTQFVEVGPWLQITWMQKWYW